MNETRSSARISQGQEPLSRERERPQRLDFLIVDQDAQRSLQLVREISDCLELRAIERPNGREALASLTRTRFDAVIVRQRLGDIDCWRWIRMVRSGRFCQPSTPVFVLCSEPELAVLEPMLDLHTRLLIEDDPQAMRALIGERLWRGRSVLLIEDDAHCAMPLLIALHKYYRVEAAASGDEGLSLWRRHAHDLVLLDLELPGTAAGELLRQMLSERPTQTVVVFGACDNVDAYCDMMLSGAADFLPKPIDPRALPALCARALTQQAYLANVNRSVVMEDAVDGLVRRVRAAQYTLERGQAARAARHLSQAVIESRARSLSDDTWAFLLDDGER